MPELNPAFPFINGRAQRTNLDSLNLSVIARLHRRLPYPAGSSMSIIRTRNAVTHHLPGRIRIDSVQMSVYLVKLLTEVIVLLYYAY